MFKIIGADDKEYGPISAEVLRQWIQEGRANGQTKVLPEGLTEWKPIAEVPELASMLVSETPPPTAPGPIAASYTRRNNSNAIAGLTLGIMALTFGVCCCYGLPFSIPGIICSILALNQISKDPSTQQGKGIAITGLVLSILSILVGALLFCLGIATRTPEMFRRIHRL
jgi:hypothetical protein